MKTKPAKIMNPRRALVPVFLLFLFSLVLDAGAQNFQRKVFQLDFSGLEENAHITNSIIVPEGEVWEIVQLYGSGETWHSVRILIDGEEVATIAKSEADTWEGEEGYWRFIHSVKYSAPIIVGPATLHLVSSRWNPGVPETQAPVMLIYRVTTETGPNPTPSNTVVIPSDAAGPVEIILESSVDLVNWTRAEPGEYGASTEKRFFRLRAVAKQ
jgi:hypothetical protein